MPQAKNRNHKNRITNLNHTHLLHETEININYTKAKSNLINSVAGPQGGRGNYQSQN